MKMTDGEGQLRHGAQGVEQIGLDAGVCQGEGGLPGEGIGEAAGVVGDDHAALGLAFLLEDVAGQGHGRPADVVCVHAVGARAQHAAQTGRAELQIAVKGVSDLVRVVLHGGKLLPQLRVQRLLRTPVLISLFRKFHICIPPANCFFVLYHSLYIVATGRKRADGCLRVLCHA